MYWDGGWRRRPDGGEVQLRLGVGAVPEVIGHPGARQRASAVRGASRYSVWISVKTGMNAASTMKPTMKPIASSISGSSIWMKESMV